MNMIVQSGNHEPVRTAVLLLTRMLIGTGSRTMALLPRLSLLVVLAIGPLAAHAGMGCNLLGTPLTLAAGTLKVPANAALGTTIAALPAQVVNTNCWFNDGITPSGITASTLFVDLATTAVLAPGYDDVYQTDIAGVGVRFALTSAQCNASGVRFVNGATSLTCPQTGVIGAPATPLPISITATLVLTGSIGAGAHSVTSASIPTISVNYRTSTQTGTWLQISSLYGAATGSVSTLVACSVSQSTVAVAMSRIALRALPSIGSVAGAVPFTLSLNCTSGAKVAITLTDNVSPANGTNTLVLTAASTATGVGVQVLNGSTPVLFGPDSAAAGNQNQWVIGDSVNGSMQVPLVARYIRTGATMTAGTVNAVATFTLSFQ